ncbi:MAG: deoxyribodipyrimidine photolyase [Legionella sp.]|nr:MAG: deoxyribodipyrimidine photolyase [Legionella sp.]
MTTALVWFRQDLRCSDNPALTLACHEHTHLLPLYVKDTDTQPLGGAQQWWLHHSLLSLDATLQQHGLNLILRQGNALDIILKLVKDHAITTVYWNRCYEPKLIARDTLIKAALIAQGIVVQSCNGSLLHEPWTIKNKSGGYFKVFTPFWRHCLQTMVIPNPTTIARYPNMIPTTSDHLVDWALRPKHPNWAEAFPQYWQPGEKGAHEKLQDFVQHHIQGYHHLRDVPAADATSRLSPHLHFGEISPWQIWRILEQIMTDPTVDLHSAQRFLAEIGWREFSYHLLYHFPELPNAHFNAKFDTFPWQNDVSNFIAWQKGLTGFPIVDAGMRQLWKTGYMHNRVRMIVASFLIKDLLIDWRLGADWFLDTLVDADLASNSASWQWVAGSGADAAPYFRIFNPMLQSEKFDPNGDYIREWVPELSRVDSKWIHQPWLASDAALGLCLGKEYPKPIVDHGEARKKALQYYQLTE